MSGTNQTAHDPLGEALARARARRRLPPPAERRRLRERVGLTQAELAEALGVDRAAVSRWEAGDRTPSRALAVRYLGLLERLATESLTR